MKNENLKPKHCIGYWEYELPISFRKEVNYMDGFKRWSKYIKYNQAREIRRKKLKRILKSSNFFN